MKEAPLSYQEFLESDSFYRVLVENANEAIFVAQDGYIRYANPKTLELSGYSEKELMARPFVEIIHPEDSDIVMDRHLRRLRGEQFINIYPFRIFNKDGNIRWVENNVVMIRWWDRPATLNFSSDITEKKRAEDALRESEGRYRTLFQSVPAAVFSYGMDCVVFDCNDEMSRLLRTTCENIVGTDLKGVRDRRIFTCLEAALSGNDGLYEGDYRSTLGDAALWIILRTSPLRDKNGDIAGGIGMVQDMTAYQKAKEELAVKSQFLEEANTALRVFARSREEEQAKMKNDILANVRTLILPYVDKLRMSRSEQERALCIDLIESNLHRLVSPFLRTVSHYQMNFTPREIEIADLIRDGKSSKEIGELLNISVKSVEFYRSKIRRKLGLTGSRTNLRSQLLANT